MIEKVISDYMEAHLRLTLPGFGTLIRRDSGEIVFTEMLRSDDGILTAKVAEYLGISKENARATVDTTVASFRKELSETGQFTLPGLGSFEGHRKQTGPANKSDIPRESRDIDVQLSKPTEKSVENSTEKDTVSSRSAFVPNARTTTAPKQEHVSQTDEPAFAPGRIHIRQHHKRKKVDRTLLLAIIAIAIAIGVLVYGYFAEQTPKIELDPDYMEVGIEETSGQS